MSEPRKFSRRPERSKSQERMLYLPLGFHVLLALAEGPASTTEIIRRTIGHTTGRFLGRSSLYDEIQRLEKAGLISRSREGWPAELRLTAEGERKLRLAAGETKRVVNVAQGLKLC